MPPDVDSPLPEVVIVTARLPARGVLADLLGATRSTFRLLDLDAQLVARLASLRRDGVDVSALSIHDTYARVPDSLPSRTARIWGRGFGSLRRWFRAEPWATAARRSWTTLTPPRPAGVQLPAPARAAAPAAREIRRPDGSVAMRERRDAGGAPFQRDYVDVDGRAYLTRWVDRRSGTAKGAIALADGKVTRYTRLHSWHAGWLRQVLPDGEHTPVVGLGQAGADAVAALAGRHRRALVLEPDTAVPAGAAGLPITRLGGDPVEAVLAALREVSG